MRATPRVGRGDRPTRRYFKEVRFRQIRALVELARRGSFAAAARVLEMSTPSIWRQVRALEDEFGVELVVVRGRAARLTADGTLLVDLAAPLVEGFDSLRHQFGDRRRDAVRGLRVAAPAAVLGSVLRDAVAAYRHSHPTVRLTLTDVPSQAAWRMVERDEADLAIVGRPAGRRLAAVLAERPLAAFPFHVVCPASHPLLGVPRLTLRRLLEHPLILADEQSSSRMHFDHVVARAGLSGRVDVAMTAGNLAVILGYVAAGIGVAVASRPLLDPLPQPPAGTTLVARDASGCLGLERIVLVQRRGRHEAAHVAAFRELVTAACGTVDPRPAPPRTRRTGRRPPRSRPGTGA